MEEIRIYRSFWKWLLMSIFIIVSYGALILILSINKDIGDAVAGDFKYLIIISFFCVLYGFFLLFESLWEKFSPRPYIVITDKGIAVNTLLKKKYIDFADVARFDVKQVYFLQALQVLLVHYKPEVLEKKLEGLNTIQRIFRKMKINPEKLKLMFIDKDMTLLCYNLNEHLIKQYASSR